MFKTLSTLIAGVNARSEDRVRDAFAIELIDQKIREAEQSLTAAKATLASLIQRQRSEERQRDALKNRIKDMMGRAQSALDNGRDDLATEAASAVAQMENELTIVMKPVISLIKRSSAFAIQSRPATVASSTSNKVPFRPVPYTANKRSRPS